MKPLLFIQIPAHCTFEADLAYHWYKKEPAHESTGFDTLAQIREKTGACDTVLVLSGFNLVHSKVSSTLKNRQQLKQALISQLEEQLAEDIEELFFAYQRSGEKNLYEVAVVNKAWLEQCLAQFNALQMPLSVAVSELTLLEAQASDWLLIQQADTLLLKTPASAYIFDADNLAYFLRKLDGLPERLPLISATPDRQPDLSIPLALQTIPGTILQFLAAAYKTGGFNLLQAEYKVKTKTGAKLMNYSIATAFTLLFGVSAYQFYKAGQLNAKEAQLEQQMQQIFSQNFPQIKRVVNPFVQMKGEFTKLQQNQSEQTDFIPLLAHVARALTKTLAENSVQIQSIAFADAQLTLVLKAGSLEMIESTRELLKQQQLKVELSSSDKTDNQATASFIISKL